MYVHNQQNVYFCQDMQNLLSDLLVAIEKKQKNANAIVHGLNSFLVFFHLLNVQWNAVKKFYAVRY